MALLLVGASPAAADDVVHALGDTEVTLVADAAWVSIDLGAAAAATDAPLLALRHDRLGATLAVVAEPVVDTLGPRCSGWR